MIKIKELESPGSTNKGRIMLPSHVRGLRLNSLSSDQSRINKEAASRFIKHALSNETADEVAADEVSVSAEKPAKKAKKKSQTPKKEKKKSKKSKKQ